ncbi:MAG: hypothetical protein AAGJ85_07925 [Pseudomonadota bacterium]
MGPHLKIALGLVLVGIFLFRGLEALSIPGLGIRELYVVGGFVLAGVLIHQGWKGVQAKRAERSESE